MSSHILKKSLIALTYSRIVEGVTESKLVLYEQKWPQTHDWMVHVDQNWITIICMVYVIGKCVHPRVKGTISFNALFNPTLNVYKIDANKMA